MSSELVDPRGPATKPIRVAVFTDHFSPHSSGGIEKVVWEVYRRLSQRNVHVLVITAVQPKHAPYPDSSALKVHVEPMWDGSSRLGVQVGVSAALFRRATGIIEAFGPDVIHANGLHCQSTLAAAFANRRRNRPMVFTGHVAGMHAIGQPARGLTSVYEKTVGRYILRRSDRIIVVSESVGKHFESTLGVDRTRIHCISNGVDHSVFVRRRDNTDAGPNGPLLMFIGRQITNKGPQVFLEALALLREWGLSFRAEFLGDGPLNRQLERRARHLRMDGIVHFRGHVSDVASQIGRADIVVRPSLTEGMPLALLETMAAGVCSVVTDIPGNRDLIRDGSNGLLVAPRRPDALARALRRLIESPDLRRDLGRRAFEDSLAYSWDRCASETLAVLQDSMVERALVPVPSVVQA